MVFGKLRDKLKSEIELLKEQITKIDWREYDYWGKVKVIKDEIKRIQYLLDSNIIITKHARERYFQRFGKRLIVNDEVLLTIEKQGDGHYLMDDGSVFLVKNKKIVTVLTQQMLKNKLK